MRGRGRYILRGNYRTTKVACCNLYIGNFSPYTLYILPTASLPTVRLYNDGAKLAVVAFYALAHIIPVRILFYRRGEGEKSTTGSSLAEPLYYMIYIIIYIYILQYIHTMYRYIQRIYIQDGTEKLSIFIKACTLGEMFQKFY